MIVRAMLAVSMAVAAPAVAQESEPKIDLYSDVAGWFVFKSQSDCAMSTTYNTPGGQESSLTMIYDYRLKEVSVSFSDPSIKSLKEGDTRKLKIFFINGRASDDGWGEKTFNIYMSENVTTFKTLLTDEFLTDFAKNTTLAFFTGDVLLQSYDLKDSAVAVTALRACALKQSRVNPSDPFAK